MTDLILGSGSVGGVTGFIAVARIAADGPKVLSTLPTGSATFVAEAKHTGVLYATIEEASGSILASFIVTASGQIEQQSSVAIEGAVSHVMVSSSGYVLTSNYGDGSVSCFAVDTDGKILREVSRLRFAGSGPTTSRQDAAHPHQIVEVAGSLFVPDLGSDKVWEIVLDAAGTLRARRCLELPPGIGPRHLVMLGELLVVAGELSGRVLWANLAAPALTWNAMPSVSAPPDVLMPSAIKRVGGNRVAVASRGPGTISIFERQGDDLVYLEEFSGGGTWPRDIEIVGDYVLVANARDGRVCAVEIGGSHQLAWTWSVEGPLVVIARQ